MTDGSDILQRKERLNEPIQHLLREQIPSLAEYPSVQKAASFDFSELIKHRQAGKP